MNEQVFGIPFKRSVEWRTLCPGINLLGVKGGPTVPGFHGLVVARSAHKRRALWSSPTFSSQFCYSNFNQDRSNSGIVGSNST